MDGKLKNDLLINVCLTGCVHYKKDNPYLPVTPKEISDDVYELVKWGAQLFHIHAREEDETPTWKKDVYQKIIDEIRNKTPNVVICVSTSGRHWSDIELRADCLDCEGVDMASLTLGSHNFYTSTSYNDPNTIRELLLRMNNRGIKPELEVFELGQLFFAHRLIKEGLLEPPYYFNILFGSPWSMPLKLDVVATVLNNLPDNSIVSFAGIGKFQYEANMLGLMYGDGVRIGLEDNLYYNNEPAANVQLVKRLTRLINAIDRPLARDVREWLF